ncbi:MAG TPA: serine/threonine-protein kinase [Ktedonobacteraceae bacterium]|nr:serine/threonine-protein kinase [Ktedonobacteraceae bacterium]
MASSLFCDTCGAALPAQADSCPVCGKAASDYSATTDNTASPAAPSQMIVLGQSEPGPGSLLAGRYRILEKIGEGGFGVVYKARDEQMWGKLVAVKQINMAALSTQEKIEATDSFNREITLLAGLQHRSLPHIYDHFTDPEHWYVVMNYIEGQTLEELLKTLPGGRLSLKHALKIGMQLCDVLGYLHNQEPAIIFRDVKPGNIMLTRRGQLYLIDFGIARRYREGQAKDTGPLGSPGYAAPEQYGRAQTTPQTDIYGLGATLQTLLTGKEPLEIRVHGVPPDCAIPWQLQALITRMMERDADKRPQNMDEVYYALREIRQHPAWRYTKNAAATSWTVLKNLVLQQIGLLAALFLTRTLMGDDPFSIMFWAPYFLISAAITLGQTAYYLHQISQNALSRPTVRDISIKVGKYLSRSLRDALLPTILLYWLYLRPGTLFAPLDIFLIWLFGMYWVFQDCYHLLKWLSDIAARRFKNPPRPRPQQQAAQSPPLQQQTRRHP